MAHSMPASAPRHNHVVASLPGSFAADAQVWMNRPCKLVVYKAVSSYSGISNVSGKRASALARISASNRSCVSIADSISCFCSGAGSDGSAGLRRPRRCSQGCAVNCQSHRSHMCGPISLCPGYLSTDLCVASTPNAHVLLVQWVDRLLFGLLGIWQRWLGHDGTCLLVNGSCNRRDVTIDFAWDCRNRIMPADP